MKRQSQKSEIILVFLTVIVLVCGQRNRVELNNNEYTGLLVAISENIPEDFNLIERIKVVFTRTSSYLYEATEHRVYFKDVTILIPRTWSDNITKEAATTERFCIANIVVDKPNPEYGESPYVKQIRSCGQPGEYMHLTSRWLTDVSFAEYNWGDSGKVIVHEWGHLRWGLFDEYAVEDYEHFYYDEQGRVEPTRCSKAIVGKSQDIDDRYRRCNLKPDLGIYPSPGCRFFPDLDNSDGKSSYMFGNYLDSVIGFCHNDPEKDQDSKHNRMARNKQNKNCCYKSAWEVMLNTPDFINGSNPARDIEDRTPSFRVVQEKSLRIVLVLDVSGSMDNTPANPTRFDLMIQSSTKYIQYTVPNNTYVGIVIFSTTATILSDLVYVNNNEARQLLVSRLPASPTGWTSIGAGLESGIEVLEGGPSETAEGGILFLLTDGDENRSPYIDDVIPELLSKKVVVDSLAFSNAADGKMTYLSDITNGFSFYYPETSESTALNDAFTATITERTCSSKIATPIQLISKKSVVASGDTSTNHTFIDSSVGAGTTFFFFWESDQVKVTLESPSGDVIMDGSAEYQVDPSTKSIIIEIAGVAENGKWTYNITNPGSSDQSVEVSIESRSSDSSLSPILLSSTLSDDLITESPPVAIVYADLNRGYVPVLKATVFATIDRPEPDKNRQSTIQLLDNGVGADISKNDGIYSAYFVDFIEASCPQACRYSVQVTANDQDGNALTQIRGRVGALPKKYDVIPANGEANPIGDFSRIASGGVLQVADDVEYAEPGTDLFPPARIADLEVVSTSYDDQIIVLQWTATGNDYDKGTADHYDLRISSTFSNILDNFNNATNITDSDIANGNLSAPLPAESLETFEVNVLFRGTGKAFYFGVIAVDESGNRGALSNIAQTTLVLPEEEDSLEVWHIVLIAVGAVILVAIIVIAIICVVRRFSM
ncbi:calcium-activated chloride channel regulator 4A-like [Glandiceps talaboti]